MSYKKQTIKNLIYSLLSQVITITLGLLIPRLTLIGYGSETNGLLSSVTQFIVYLGLFETGIQMVAKQSLYRPVCLGDHDAINRIIAAVHRNYRRLGIGYFAVLTLLSLIYPFIAPVENTGYITIFAVFFFSGFGNVILFFYQGKYKILLQVEGKNHIIINLQTIIRILTDIAKIILLFLKMNIAVVIFVSFVISLIQAGYILLYIKKKYSWLDLHAEPNFEALRQKNHVLILQITTMICQNTDVLILTIFCGLKVVSVYSIYRLIIGHLNSVLCMLYGSFDFALGQIYNTDRRRYVRLIDVVDTYFGAFQFATYTVALCLILPFLRLYTGGTTDIVYVDPYLAFMFVTSEILTFMRYPLLNTITYAGHFKNILTPSIIEAGINLIFSLIGVQIWGIYGVLLGTLISLLYRTVDVWVYSNCKLLDRGPWKTMCIYGIDIVLMILVLICYKQINIVIHSYWDFLWVGAAMEVACVLLFCIVPSCIFLPQTRSVLKHIRKRIE